VSAIESNDELRQWADEWVRPVEPPVPADRLRRFVRRRGRLRHSWFGLELGVAVAMFGLLASTAAAQTDPVVWLMLAALAVITAAALAFSVWSWWSARPPLTETTATFLALAGLRCRLLRRGVVAGWILLGAEVAVFVPLLSYRVGTPLGRSGPWLFLAGMVALAVLGLVGLDWWARREARIVESLRVDLDRPDRDA
jgi:hypothetical protein